MTHFPKTEFLLFWIVQVSGTNERTALAFLDFCHKEKTVTPKEAKGEKSTVRFPSQLFHHLCCIPGNIYHIPPGTLANIFFGKGPGGDDSPVQNELFEDRR